MVVLGTKIPAFGYGNRGVGTSVAINTGIGLLMGGDSRGLCSGSLQNTLERQDKVVYVILGVRGIFPNRRQTRRREIRASRVRDDL